MGKLAVLTLIIQALCIGHVLKNGKDKYWIWVIMVPGFGAAAYVLYEIFNTNNVSNIQQHLKHAIIPKGKLSELQAQLAFSDSFKNKMLLANAYVENGSLNEAIELYETCADGPFKSDSSLLKQQVKCYHHLGRHQDAVNTAQSLLGLKEFTESQINVLYALSLEHVGKIAQSESEFRTITYDYGPIEPRINFGKFLQRQDKSQEARTIFMQILKESEQMGSKDRRTNKYWLNLAHQELTHITNP